MKIEQQFSVRNDCYVKNQNGADSRYTEFQKLGPRGLMLHSVGCSQPDAHVFARLWNVPDKEVAVHAVLQEDGLVIQCLPWNYRGWHAGGTANNTHVGVEMTESSYVIYDSKTGAYKGCSNLVAARAHSVGCYKTAVELFAKLCKQYKLDPMTAIISHSEGAKKDIASQHADPEHLWRALDLSYTMDGFRKDVAKAMNPPKEEPDLTAEEVKKIVKEEIKNLPAAPVTKSEVLTALGDQYVGSFVELPDWAKPEMRELIERGYFKGTKPAETVEETVINGTVNGLVRPIIVAWRAIKDLEIGVTEAGVKEILGKIIEGLSKD